MKFSLFKNDKSTAKDEFILFVFVAVCLAAGIYLVVKAPTFWLIEESMSKTFGVLWILVAMMFIPALIYRLFTNNKK